MEGRGREGPCNEEQKRYKGGVEPARRRDAKEARQGWASRAEKTCTSQSRGESREERSSLRVRLEGRITLKKARMGEHRGGEEESKGRAGRLLRGLQHLSGTPRIAAYSPLSPPVNRKAGSVCESQ